MSNRITNVAAIVSGRDTTFSGTMRSVREELARTTNVAEQIAAKMRGIDVLGGIVPTFDVGELVGGMFSKARQAYEQFAADIGTIDRRAQEAEGLGFTYNQLRALEVAATLADVPLDRLSGTFARFLKTVAMAGEGSKEAEKDLARLGLRVKDFEGMTSWQAIQRVADQIAAMPTPAERAAASMEIFGREAGLKMVEVLGRGGAAMDGYIAKAAQLGITLDEQLIGKAKVAADEIDFLNMRFSGARERANAELAGSGVEASVTALANAPRGLGLAASWMGKIVDDFGEFATIAADMGLDQAFRSIATDNPSNANVAPAMFPNALWDTSSGESPAIVQAEDEAKKLEAVYDAIEAEQKASAERIAAWRDQVRQQALEREYREVGEQIERLEKERMESERRAADEAEKQARELDRVRMNVERAAASAWDSTGGGLGASPLAVMGTAEQQLASYQASRARESAQQRQDFIRNAIREAMQGVVVNTNVVRGGVTAVAI
jgi:hypothetical protein